MPPTPGGWCVCVFFCVCVFLFCVSCFGMVLGVVGCVFDIFLMDRRDARATDYFFSQYRSSFGYDISRIAPGKVDDKKKESTPECVTMVFH